MVGARAPGTEQISCVVFLEFRTRTKRKTMAFFEGCPVGWGGYPPELAKGLGGGVGAMTVRLGGCSKEEQVQGREGLAWRSGGCKGFGCGGVGGRGTGPRDGANFATCVVFLLFLTRTKRGPVGWGGYPPELAWDQGP